MLRSDERNDHNCENCQAQPRPKAEINTFYESLPRMLILQMQYEYDMVGNDLVKAKGSVPLPLELQCFCVECNDGQPKENHKYHLNSIVMHAGWTSETGHYSTIARHLNSGGNNERCCRIKMNTGAIRGKNLRETWLKCNDVFITFISQEFMNNILRNGIQKPQLVFYARNDIVTEVQNN